MSGRLVKTCPLVNVCVSKAVWKNEVVDVSAGRLSWLYVILVAIWTLRGGSWYTISEGQGCCAWGLLRLVRCPWGFRLSWVLFGRSTCWQVCVLLRRRMSLHSRLGSYPIDSSSFWTPPDFWDAEDLAMEMAEHPCVWTDGNLEPVFRLLVLVSIHLSLNLLCRLLFGRG